MVPWGPNLAPSSSSGPARQLKRHTVRRRQEHSVVRVYTPRSEAELGALRALLQAEGISCHVQNEHFGSVYPGMAVGGFNSTPILVAEQDAERALELVQAFLADTDPGDA